MVGGEDSIGRGVAVRLVASAEERGGVPLERRGCNGRSDYKGEKRMNVGGMMAVQGQEEEGSGDWGKVSDEVG